MGRDTTDKFTNKIINSDDNTITVTGGSGALGLYGNGILGDAVLSNGTSTLSSDTYYNNLTLDNYILSTRNNRLFVRGTLTLKNGSLCCNNANSGSGGTGGTAIGNQTSFPLGPSIGAGNGGLTNGFNGNATPANQRLGGIGGAGGAGGSGVGGSAGSSTVINAARGGIGIFNALPCALSGRALDNVLVNGGNGGGGGGGNGVQTGGGGGAGAGGLILSANVIVDGGGLLSKICANAGNGAPGQGTNCGGGGGGGGGYVVVVTSSISDTIVVEAKGGTGGAGVGTGVNGVNGADGYVNILIN